MKKYVSKECSQSYSGASNKHLFVTQAADGAVSKSPIGMFEDTVIDNDMLLVEKAIRDYYEIGGKKDNAETK